MLNGNRSNGGVTAMADASTINIGRRRRIGPNVMMIEGDLHALPTLLRCKPSAIARRHVGIGDDVFIAAGTVVLKGVSISSPAASWSGADVEYDIPDCINAADNPGRVAQPL